MLSRKKVARLRLLAFLAALALVAAIFFAVSAVSNAYHMKFMNMPELSGQIHYRKAANDGVDASDPTKFTSLDPLSDDENLTKAAENDTMILYTHNGFKGIKVYDKRTAQVWSSYVENEDIINQVQGFAKSEMVSFFSFHYMELHTNIQGANIHEGFSCDFAPATRSEEDAASDEGPLVTSERIEDGVCWNFDLKELNIKLSIHIVLDGDALVVEVPDEKIVERQDALEKIAASKKQMEQSVESIRGILEGVKSSVASSGVKDSIKKVIDKQLEDAIKRLTSIKTTAGTSKLNPLDIDEMRTNVEKAIKRLNSNDLKDQAAKLQQAVVEMDNVVAAAQELSSGIPHGLIDLTVMPFFGAQEKTTDGYVFYPDGSGAISYFNVQHPSTAGRFVGAVYGAYDAMVSVGNSANTDNAILRGVEMPVYGIKAGDSAFIAILTKGDTDSTISYVPISDAQPLGSAYGTYLMRKSTSMVNAAGGHTLLYDTHRTNQNLETRYCFLAGEKNANYSGMANVYRSYLKETNQLNKSKLLEAQTMPLALEFFMGTNSMQQTLFGNYITMTKFEDVLNTVKELEGDGLTNLMVSVYGWQQDYSAKAMPAMKAAKQLGGNSALKQLTSYMTGKGYLLSLDKSMTWVDADEISSAQRNIAAIKAKSQMIRSWENMYAMNPVYVYNTFIQKDLESFKSFGVNAAYLYEIDSTQYDYNKNAPVDRLDTAQIFNKINASVQEKLGYALVNQTPQYLMSATDWTLYVNEDDSNYLYADSDVPFYQIVIHGNIVYTGEGFNYMYNSKQQNLKYIEYGYIPFYLLTKEEPYELRMSGLKHNFYSTVIDDWYDRVVTTYNQYSAQFGDIWNVEIQSHERINSTLGCTTYVNGVQVYVNYAKTAQTVGGVTVPAEDYVVVR